MTQTRVEVPQQRQTADSQGRPARSRKTKRFRKTRRMIRAIATLILIYFIITGTFLMCGRFYGFPTSAFMYGFKRSTGHEPLFQWVDGENVSRNMVEAVIAHEDQRLPTRTGWPFSWSTEIARFKNALTRGTGADRGGSTIPQQLAKNLFLWEHKDFFRKALEIPLSAQTAWILGPKDTLSAYMNLAQFGPNIYGVCTASWYYFGVSPRDLTINESAELVGLLPNPTGYARALHGGVAYQSWIVGKDGKTLQQGDLVAWALAHIREQEAAANSGGESLQAAIDAGFTRSAYQHERQGQGCDIMPRGVFELLASSGYNPWERAKDPVVGKPAESEADRRAMLQEECAMDCRNLRFTLSQRYDPRDWLPGVTEQQRMKKWRAWVQYVQQG